MEKEYTLEDIANANTSQFGSRELDNGNPYSWAKAKPMEFTQDVEEMGKNYTITIDQVKNYLAPREAGTMENIGSGLVQVGSQLLEASAGLDLFFKKNSFPDLNDKEAQDLIALATHNLESIKANRAEMLSREGIGGFAFQASNVIGQAALSAVAGLATGGAVLPVALGGVQEFGRKTGDYAIKYAQETGDYSLKDQSAKDDLIALAYAGVSAAIEAGIGAERVLNGLIAKGSLKQAGKAALGEAAEEFLQEYAEYAADSVAGYNERGELEVFKDALTGAVYGALGGGVMGFGMYYANKGKLTELFTRQGFDPATAKSMAVEAIDDAKKTTIAELITRDQLEKHYGQKYEDLKVKIDTVINNVQGLSFLTQEQRTNYIETVASDLSRQVMIQAAMFKTDTDSILNLSDIEAIGNQLVLNTPDMHDQVILRQRIADKKAQLKELRSIKTQKKAQKLGVEGETEQESRLNLQIQALQNQIKRLDEEDLIENKIVSRRNGGVDVVGQAIDAGKNFIASAEAPTQQGLEGWLSDTPRTYRKWFARNTIPESVRANLLSNATKIKDVAKIHPDIKTDIQNALKRIANGLTMDTFAEMMSMPTRDANPFQSASFAYLLLSDPDVSLSAIASYTERLQAQQSYKDGAMQTPDDIMSQVVKENTLDKWNTDGTTDDKALLMLYNQKTISTNAAIPDDILNQTDLANENARLDAENPVYEGETINIDGKERTVYNSNGERIAQSEPALRNFYKWFGNSKVVDEQGRPLVVYHGTGAEFDTFDMSLSARAFFTDSKIVADTYQDFRGKKQTATTMPVYLKLNNPLFVDFNGNSYRNVPENIDSDIQDYLLNRFDSIDEASLDEVIDYADEETNHDGVVAINIKDYAISDTASWEAKRTIANDYIVFEPNQIKSVNNRGTFSEDTGNIYFQSAYAGSRVDYEQPSLEAIGSGEGNQAHGWGLYYALNPEIAERYRQGFVGEIKYNITFNNKEYIEKDNPIRFQNLKYISLSGLSFNESKNILLRNLRNDRFISDTTRNTEIQFLESLTEQDAKNISVKRIQEQGQVHEVDIPEMDVLLDEQLPFNAQSKSIQNALKTMVAKENLQSEVLQNLDNNYSGRQIYNALANALRPEDASPLYVYKGGDKLASRMLEKYGIKGITYDGQRDGRCFVIFNPKDVKVLRKKFDELGNQLFQGAGKHLAGFDPETKAIILSKSMNTGSLPHEMAHFWLQEMFNRSQGKTDLPESARASWAELSRILGITADQRTLTADQQEKFANLTEAYIFNKTALPAGTEPVIKDYMEYVPERYNSFLDMGWVDGNGVVQNPILNEDSKRWFDAYYSGMGLFGDSPTMTKFAVSNEPAKEDVRTERQEILDNAHKEVIRTRQDAEKAIDENVPVETKQKIVDKIQDYDAAAKDFLAPAENSDDINDKKRSVWQKTMDLLHAGRGTDTREETMQKVNDWVKKHWDEALAIATLNPNYYDNPTEIPTSLLIRAVSEQNTDPAIKDLLRANFAMAKSLEMKTGGLNNDTHDSMFLIGLGKIQNNLNQAYALKRFGATKNATARVDSEIAKFCERYAGDVMSGRKSWQDVMALAATEFGKVDGIDSQVLSQTQLPKNASRQDFIKYMKHLIKVQAGAEMTGEQIAKFNEVATAAQIASTDLDSESESVYLAASAALRRYHDFVAESIVADNWFDKVAGQYFNRAMLSGLTTQTKNLVGNKFENWIVRAAIATKYGKSQVSTETITKERNRLTKIYESSLLSIPQMENLSDPTLVHGEGYGLSDNSVNIAGIRLQTLGKTSIPDPLAMLGRSDFYFRREVYLASLAARATQYATENNLDPDVVFKEFKKLSTTNETAGDARKEAILLGHTAVFTQNGSLAQALNKVRRVLNEMIPLGRRYGLGNLIAPFTKTPSNIVEMGARAIVSPFTSIYEYATTKELSLQHRVDLGNLAGALLLFAVTAALSGDYEPPYKVGEKYDAKRHYDSLRIGGVWIKLDSFGAMETPLRLLLGTISTAKGAWPRVVAGTFAQIPVDISKLEYALTKPAKGGTSFVEGEIDKFIPTIASDAAKAFGHQSGIVLDSPYLMGNKTIRKLGLDGAEPSVNDWIRLIGMGIIQIDNKE